MATVPLSRLVAEMLLEDPGPTRMVVPDLADLEQGALGTQILAGSSSHWEFEGAVLILTLALDEHLRPISVASNNQPFTATLRDGSTLSARLGFVRNDFFGRITLELHDWVWQRGKASLWRAPITKSGSCRLERGGLAVRRTSETFNFRTLRRFDGQCVWYLTEDPNDDSRLLAFLEMPNGEAHYQPIKEDLFCLQFTLGRQIVLPVLLGIDETRQLVSAIGLGHLDRRMVRTRSPVPDFNHVGQVGPWHSDFFQKLSRATRPDRLRLFPAMSVYLDSLANHFDAANLLAHVGLEATLKKVASDAEKKARWDAGALEAWFDTVKDGSPLKRRDLQSLCDSARYSAEPTPPMILTRFMKRFGVKVPDEIRTVVSERNAAAHSYMTMGLNYTSVATSKLAKLQATIAAIVAAEIGYRGPLSGYRRDSLLEWWPSEGGPPEENFYAFEEGTTEAPQTGYSKNRLT